MKGYRWSKLNEKLWAWKNYKEWLWARKKNAKQLLGEKKIEETELPTSREIEQHATYFM